MIEDLDYLRRRLAQEDALARRMIGTEAELVHRALATSYARRAMMALAGMADNDTGADLQQSA